MAEPKSPDERYAALVRTFAKRPGVVHNPPESKKFGSSALTAGGRIFAMLVRGRLVVKLPRQRVDALVATGDGERFDPGRGRQMKEWLVVGEPARERWPELAEEALGFVGSRH